MVTMETPTRNFVLGRKVLDTGFFHPIPVSDDIVPVNLGKYEITSATLVNKVHIFTKMSVFFYFTA